MKGHGERKRRILNFRASDSQKSAKRENLFLHLTLSWKGLKLIERCGNRPHFISRDGKRKTPSVERSIMSALKNQKVPCWKNLLNACQRRNCISISKAPWNLSKCLSLRGVTD